MWQGKGAWHFVTITSSDAEVLVDQYIWPRKGFGSIPVTILIGKSSWKTSIFPEKGGSFLLPIKKSIRVAENLVEGKEVSFQIKVIN